MLFKSDQIRFMEEEDALLAQALAAGPTQSRMNQPDFADSIPPEFQ